tara:strand:- start:743 stop:1498 length:756 start_codon:yes stop_codon:yes gene_type:complete
MMKKLTTLFLALVAIPYSLAQTPDVKGELYNTIYGKDVGAMESLYNTLSVKADNGEGEQSAFWASYMAYRLGPIHLYMDKAKGEKFLNSCVAHSKQVSPDSPRKAESYAVSSLCYGQLIGANPMKAAAYGSAAANALDAAYAMAPENPHVLLIGAINDIYTPEQWGGDKARALVRLSDAFDVASNDPQWNWLLPEIHAYRALALAKNGKLDDAEEALADARELTPEFGFLNVVVTPTLKRMAATQTTAKTE